MSTLELESLEPEQGSSEFPPDLDLEDQDEWTDDDQEIYDVEDENPSRSWKVDQGTGFHVIIGTPQSASIRISTRWV